jgi:Predicted DNA-binding proteins
MSQLEQLHLAADEFEALRLVDLQGMQQQEAAVVMGVSRQTLANILKLARFKVVSCLSEGKALIMHREEHEQSNQGDSDHDHRHTSA